MIGSRMGNADALLEQEHAKRSKGRAGTVAPGRTVVGDEGARQAVAVEGTDQGFTHGLRLLVGAGAQYDRIARVIIEHGQWIEPAAVGEPDMALEVHLPQVVGLRMFEAGPVGAAAAE